MFPKRLLIIIVVCLFPTEFSWGEVGEICFSSEIVDSVTRPEQESDAILQPLLAEGCPDLVRESIVIDSCHTVHTECWTGESLLDCGKRALMNADWEKALQVFSSLPESCEVAYGRFLSRLLRLNANWNSRFFKEGFNQINLNYELLNPLNTILRTTVGNPAAEYYEQYACLTQAEFPTGLFGNPLDPYLFPRDFAENNLIDEDLDTLVANDCALTGLSASHPLHNSQGVLPIRYQLGACDHPAIDAVMVGIWDEIDAVNLYQHTYGSPLEARRFIFGLLGFLEDWSNTEPCDHPICSPMGVPDLEGRLLEAPRLTEDVEWFLKHLYDVSHEMFRDTTRDNAHAVFSYQDEGGPGASREDALIVRICNYEDGTPAMDLSDATLGAQWAVEPGPYPIPNDFVFGEPETVIYCGGESEKDCSDPDFVIEEKGERALDEEAPLWLRNYLRDPNDTFTQGGLLRPSANNRYLVFNKENSEVPGRWDLYIALNESLDGTLSPVCHRSNDPADMEACCVTCDTEFFPNGVLQAAIQLNADNLNANVAVYPLWIEDTHANADRPKAKPLGAFFMHNEHPSSWGNQAVAQASSLIAVSFDRVNGKPVVSRLLPETIPPRALQYQFHISPDGRKIYWTSTWDPATNTVGGHRLLIGTILFDPRTKRFSLGNIHSALDRIGHDHGWYEAHEFDPDYPAPGHRRIYFTSTAQGAQNLTTYVGLLDEEDYLEKIYRLDWPNDDPVGKGCSGMSSDLDPTFVVTCHPAWNEHARPVDHGYQVMSLTTDALPTDETAVAADRHDRLLHFPPVLEGVMMGGLYLFQSRAVGFNLYDATSYVNGRWKWILQKIDGTDRAPLLDCSEGFGWKPFGLGLTDVSLTPILHNGKIYFVQEKRTEWWQKPSLRFGTIDFIPSQR